MKWKTVFKSPIKATKDTFEDIRNPGKRLKTNFKGMKKDLLNPKETFSDRWENIKDNPFPSIRPGIRGPYSQTRPEGKPAAPGEMGAQQQVRPIYGSHDMPAWAMPRNPRPEPISQATPMPKPDPRMQNGIGPMPIRDTAAIPGLLQGIRSGQAEYDPGVLDLRPPTPRPFPPNMSDIDPGYSAPPRGTRLSPGIYADGRGGSMRGRPPATGLATPRDFEPAAGGDGTRVGRFAPGAMPANTRGDAMRTTNPPKGTRISPGIYADGRGGTTRATPNVIPRASKKR